MSSLRMTAWMVWLIGSIFYAYQYILRVMPNIMLDDIMQQFNIGAGAFGQFSGIYYIGYSLMHLPLGIMLDRFGPKKVMTVSILLTVLGMQPLVFAEYWIYPIIGRLLIGAGSSAAILGLFKIIRMTFSEDRFPRMLSLSVMIGLLGAIYGGGPVSYMREVFGYQVVVQVFSALGIILAIATFCIIPNETSAQKTTITSDIKEVFCNSRVIWCCVFAGFMVGPLEGFADVWGTAFLKQVYGFDTTLAASLPSMIFIGMCIGSPLLSYIAEKTHSYLGTIIAAGIVMVATFTILVNWQLASGVVSFNFFIVGICCAYQILAIFKASTYVREQVAGLTTAVANMIIMIFGYAFHATIGGIINVMGGANNPDALFWGIAVIPVGLSIGVGGYILLFREDNAKKMIAEHNGV